MAGILRRSSTTKHDLRRSEEGCQTSPQYHDKGSVRFLDEDTMNTHLLAASGEKVRFSYDRNDIDSHEKCVPSVVLEEEDEDYSASVNAIMQRRSSKKSKRRSSSPFSYEEYSGQSTPRRRSSVFTTSSETAISIDDAEFKEEQIYENIRLHKEVIANVKQQPWPVRRKLKLVQQAKAYVKRHEGELQDRLKQSRSTRDILTRFNIVLIKKWQHTKRELINFMNLLIPWELRIKEIESHFGTVVASYFTFLRWLFWMNLVISIVLTALVIVPEMWLDKHAGYENRGYLLANETRLTLGALVNFQGPLEYSPLFYGYYSFRHQHGKYRIPIAYFMIGIGMYIYSFLATLRKMAVNFRQSKLSEKEDECIFTWKLFSGWDYMIGNAETSHNRTSSIVLGFKEALLEEAEKKKEKQSWKLISIRIFVNLNVLWMLIFSVKAVVSVVNKTNDRGEDTDSSESLVWKWWYQYETTIVMTVIGTIFPFIFELFGFIEKYHPRKTLRIQLGRIMALNLLNLYSMTFAQFNQIGTMTQKLETYKSSLGNITINNSTFHAESAPFSMAFDSTFPSWGKFISSSLILEKESNVLAPRTVGWLSNDSSDPLSSTKSLKDEFFGNIEPLKDPATGKYNKTLKISTNPIKLGESSVTTFPETTPFLEQENNSSTFDYWFSRSVENSSLPIKIESEISDRDETVSTTQMYSDGSFSSISTNTNSEEDKNSTPFIEEESTSTEDFTNGHQSSTNVNFSSKIAGSITNSTFPVTFQVNENVTSSTKFLNESVPSTPAIEMNNSTPAVNISSSINAGGTNSSPSTIPVENGEMHPNGSLSLANGCPVKEEDNYSEDTIGNLSAKLWQLDLETRQKARKLCWETMFGQELVKLTVADFVSSIFSTFLGDFIRALLVRYMNKFWCWDLEKKFPKYSDFKIAENILHLVNNQGLVWMGMFFSPGLPLINVIKLMLMMYLRSWAVLTCNVPHEVVFRASRSNNFYLALLLMMLFLCVLPVCYAVVILTPSWHCGPFSTQKRIYLIFAQTIKKWVPSNLHKIMDYMATPGTVIPLIIVLLLIIYYLASLTSALREANIDLKIQLRRERTEERKKMFQMASRKKRGSDIDSTFAKWKKILQEVPSTKLSEDSQTSDLIKDKKPDEDVVLKTEDEDIQKVKKIFKMKLRTESTSEKKWGTLLKMMPKQKTEAKEKPSSQGSPSKTLEKPEQTELSETLPEITIDKGQADDGKVKSRTKSLSRVPEKEKGAETPKAFTSKPSILDRWRKRASFKNTFDSEADTISDTALEEVDDDDVFIDSKEIVEIPELPKIPESISNRIKRRLQKVISMGSSSETQFYKDLEKKGSASMSMGTRGKQSDSRISSNLSLFNTPKYHPPVRLFRSKSLDLKTREGWRQQLQKRSLSLSAVNYATYE